jgi:hypothetical protein
MVIKETPITVPPKKSDLSLRFDEKIKASKTRSITENIPMTRTICSCCVSLYN